MKKLLFTASAFLVAFTITACGAKKQKERIGGPRGDRSGLNTTDTGGIPIGGGEAENGWMILDDSRVNKISLSFQSNRATSNASTQYDAIMALLSGFLDVNDTSVVGRITRTPVLAAQLRFNGNSLDPVNSRIGLVVFDEYTEQNPNDAIRIYMGPERGNASGQYSGSTLRVQFADTYGSILIDGTVSGGQVNANIYFRNNESYSSNYSSGIDTYLGSFYTNTSGFLN